MPLPEPSPLHVDIAPGADPEDPSSWSWTEVTSDRRVSDPVQISAGRRDEGSRVETTRCTLKLNNRDGGYSSENPMSPWFGELNENTPLRVRWADPLPAVLLPGVEGSVASTPHTAAFEITGDLDVRIDVLDPAAVLGSLGGGEFLVVGGRDDDDEDKSWHVRWYVDRIELHWSTDGEDDNSAAAVDPDLPGGRFTLRITLDVDDGGDTVVRFEVGDSLDEMSWTLLGEVVQSGTTSVHAGGQDLVVGSVASLPDGGHPFQGRVFGFQLRSGIGGSVVADPGIASVDADSTEWTGDDSLTWSVSGAAFVSDEHVRHLGYVAEWPTRWDQSGRDSWSPISAPGILRRLSKGRSPLRSALERDVVTNGPGTGLLEYWPLEDSSDSLSLRNALDGPRASLAGDVDLGSFDGFSASGPVLRLEGGTVAARVGSHPFTREYTVALLLLVPDDGLPNDTRLLDVRFSGYAARFELFYSTSGSGSIWGRWTNEDGAVVEDESGSPTDVEMNGQPMMLFVVFNDSTEFPDFVECLAWTRHILRGGVLDFGTAHDASLFENSFDPDLGALGEVIVGSGDVEDTAVGHLSCWSDSGGGVFGPDNDLFSAGAGPLIANRGEPAAERIVRLCAEEGVRVSLRGLPEASSPMGPQTPGQLLDLLRECELADGGVLHEYAGGLAYVTRQARYAQPAALQLDMTGGQVAAPPTPTKDDQLLINDFTAERVQGSAARHVDEAHRSRKGRYRDSRRFNVHLDEQLPDLAAWRVHLGTVDELRWPSIAIRLHHDPDLIDTWLGFRLGHRLTVEHGKTQLPGVPIDQLVDGWTERINRLTWDVDLNCVPASPWRIATLDDDDLGRLDTDGSQLDEPIDDSETSFDVATTLGPAWIDSSGFGGEFPFDVLIGGELMRVTGISGSSSPQTFTVTRSVNGVVKSHASGAKVALAEPVYLGL